MWAIELYSCSPKAFRFKVLKPTGRLRDGKREKQPDRLADQTKHLCGEDSDLGPPGFNSRSRPSFNEQVRARVSEDRTYSLHPRKVGTFLRPGNDLGVHVIAEYLLHNHLSMHFS